MTDVNGNVYDFSEELQAETGMYLKLFEAISDILNRDLTCF
jgi:predicted heme/steroid binding protein